MARATVDVSLRADIKELVSNLEKVQGVTKKEAKAMVREMKKGYDQQIKASKIAADAQIKNAKKAGKKSGEVAGQVTDQWQRMATESASIFGSGAGWLGDLEGTFDIARQSTERLGMSWVSMGTIGAAAMVGAIAAVRAFNDSQMQLIANVAAAGSQLEDYVSSAALDRMSEFTQFVTDADAAITMLKFGSDGLRGSLEDVKNTQVGMVSAGFPEFLSAVLAKVTDLEGWLEDTGAGWVRLIPQFWVAGGALNVVGAVGTEVQNIGEYAVDSAQAMRELQEEIAGDQKYNSFMLDMEQKAEKALADLRAKDEKAKDAEAKAAATDARAAATKRLATARTLAATASQMQASIDADAASEEKAAFATRDKLRKSADDALQKGLDVGEKARVRQLDDMGKLNAAYMKEKQTIEDARLANSGNAAALKETAAAMDEVDAAYTKASAALKDKGAMESMQELASDVGLAASAINELAGAASTFAGLALDNFSEIADAEAERFATLQEQKGEAKRQEIADLLEAGEITQLVADSRLKSLERNEQIRAENHNNLNKDQRKQAKTAFAVSQSAAGASVLADSAAAYMAYLIAFAWAGFGGPALAAALVGTATAAQLAVVASNKPPQFADGGLIGARTTPDHMLIAAQRGEGVVSRRGVAALGGASGLDALNKGAAGGGNVTANIVLDRRIIGQAVADLVDNSIARRTGRLAVYGG